MSYDSLLINTCDILRFTAGTADAYGTPAKTWPPLHSNIPCRYISGKGREIKGKGREIKVGAEVVIIYDELFINDIDVTEQDRVVISGVIYEILSVVFRQDGVGGHHKQLYLEVVK